MTIQWYGQNIFTIGNKEVRIVTVGTPGQSHPKTKEGDLVLLPMKKDAYGEESSVLFHENSLVIDGAGEYSYKGVTIQARAIKTASEEKILIYSLSVDGVVVVTLSSLDRQLSSDELKLLDSCDVLIIPTGGAGVLDKKGAMEVINKIEPRIVIPSYTYLEPSDTLRELVDTFLKEMGVDEVTKEKKVKITKAGLPSETTECIVLEATV